MVSETETPMALQPRKNQSNNQITNQSNDMNQNQNNNHERP